MKIFIKQILHVKDVTLIRNIIKVVYISKEVTLTSEIDFLKLNQTLIQILNMCNN